MKTLIAADPRPGQYIGYLADSLRARGVEVKCTVEGFFRPDPAIDVLHIHWPEALCAWREPSKGDIKQIGSVLDRWRLLGRPVVVTRHNAVPHAHRGTQSRALYETVLAAANAIIHLGAASLSETERLYACPQVVIPQGNCPDAVLVERAKARSTLGIVETRFVVLVFGAVRHLAEKHLILGTFCRLSMQSKMFLVPRWREATQPSWRRSPLARLHARLLDRTAEREMRIDDGLVPQEYIGRFFGAADVVFIPRLDTLNSAVLPRAYSHARAVVGPRTGNLTEALEATRNPSYKAGDPSSAAEAIAAASAQDLLALGEANRRYALKHWDWSGIAGRHLGLYSQVREPMVGKRHFGSLQ
jgi:glycosyltransferase involved in cell wall biosynthesis